MWSGRNETQASSPAPVQCCHAQLAAPMHTAGCSLLTTNRPRAFLQNHASQSASQRCSQHARRQHAQAKQAPATRPPPILRYASRCRVTIMRRRATPPRSFPPPIRDLQVVDLLSSVIRVTTAVAPQRWIASRSVSRSRAQAPDIPLGSVLPGHNVMPIRPCPSPGVTAACPRPDEYLRTFHPALGGRAWIAVRVRYELPIGRREIMGG